MPFHEALQVAQFRRAEAVIDRQSHRTQPELGLEIIASHMDVWRLARLAAVEMKTVRTNAQHRGHGVIVPNVGTVSIGRKMPGTF